MPDGDADGGAGENQKGALDCADKIFQDTAAYNLSSNCTFNAERRKSFFLVVCSV